MTVQSTITSKTFYPGGALASQSLAGLVFFAADDVRVELLDADGVPGTLLARDEDYTITGDGATGTASITPTAAWAADVRWYVSRSTAAVQPEAFPVQQPLSSAAVERGFNRSILIAQEQAEALGRAPLALPGQTPPPFNMAGINDGQVLALVGGQFKGVDNDPASAADSAAQALAQRLAADEARGETEGLRDETQELRGETEALRNGALAAVVALGGYYPAARLHIPRGLTGITITAAGSGGTNGIYTCPLTGDNLSVDAYATVVVSGGAVTSASVAAPGLYIGASPTAGLVDVSGITGLTGATLTPTIGYLKTSGQTWLTDTDPASDYLSLFRNESNVAVEVDAQFDPMSAGRAYDWAEGAGEPGGPGTKSAKGWAEQTADLFEASQSAIDAAGRFAELVPTLPRGVTFKLDDPALPPLVLALVDRFEKLGFGLSGDGAGIIRDLLALGKVSAPEMITSLLTLPRGAQISANGLTIEFGDYNYDVVIADTSSNALCGVIGSEFYSPSGLVSVTDLDAEDAKNKAYSQSVFMRRVTTVQTPTAAYNALFMYGQSLGQGDETWPALSRTALPGTFMLGGNTLSSADGAVFTQFSPTGLQPLVAKTVLGSTQYDAAGEAAGPPANARGEPSNIGWTRGAKLRLEQYLLTEADTSRGLVTINVSKSGATIGELEKGHSEGTVEYYSKYTGALTQLASAAGAASLRVCGICYMQGEHDYYQASGHTSLNLTYALYKPKLIALAADMQADAIAQTGQAKPPAFLIYQTGASFTRDVDGDGTPGLHIGMAQLDFALENQNAWMVGPVYPYTDKGGHLDSNGSRWFGHQIAKVWQRVVLEGRDWEPLRPIRIWQETPGSNVVYISYHVPFGPLVFDEPQLSGGTEYSNAGKGFRLTDSGGSVSVVSAELVRDTIVKLTCSRALDAATAYVWYASKEANGNGMVRDSDPAVASDNYVYEPDRGMYTTANIAQFVNKPYPLWNWSVAFHLPIGHEG